jgi:geranylgeranyl diphosphate synthase type II
VPQSFVATTTPQAASGGAGREVCPMGRPLRDRLRAMAADLVASWRADGQPRSVRSATGLRDAARDLVRRAGARPEHVGWTMVTIVSEFWRDRLAHGPNGRRLVLLPDCPTVGGNASATDSAGDAHSDRSVPRVCGPACGIATVWSAARDSGWVVGSTHQAVASIGGLLTGQFDGILGVAKLDHLEKAFAMLPAFALPVAAVPFEPAGAADSAAGERSTCAAALAAAAIDVDWVLGMLGVAGGGAAPVGDYLPLLREAAELFTADGLETLAARLGMDPSFGLDVAGDVAAAVGPVATPRPAIEPLRAAAATAGGFVVRGGKFLRPFITLAAFDAVRADTSGTVGVAREAGAGGISPGDGDGGGLRDAVKAAAVAIEAFHKASLVHDDIEDGDTVRYGCPTLHEQCGIPSAINSGDYLLGVGYRVIASLPGVDAATRADMVAILSHAHVRLARGQGAELWWRDASDKGLTPRESLEMYGLKTSPAFEAALALGIRLAGTSPGSVGSVDRYAHHVGTGFQVLNDLKDWEGDLENDRRAAGDLLGGRPTLMWALALDRLSASDVERLRGLAREAGREDADEATVSRCVSDVRRLYERAGVFARAAAIVAEERNQAALAAAGCKLPRLREVLEFLLDLAVPEGAIPAQTEAVATTDGGG